jgi:hypothetical protein
LPGLNDGLLRLALLFSDVDFWDLNIIRSIPFKEISYCFMVYQDSCHPSEAAAEGAGKLEKSKKYSWM